LRVKREISPQIPVPAWNLTFFLYVETLSFE
jgi:hypothetical protein